jgi:SAM-dependent methyltransferase
MRGWSPGEMRIREGWQSARSRQRQREFGPLLAAVGPGGLGDALEIGGGDGFVASLIAPACRTLASSDAHARAPAPGTERIPRVVCDATRLPFRDGAFDFIFSSSVLEHIRQRAPLYHEMARCLRAGGVMLHVMPSRTWKLMQMIFYYPNLAVGALDFLLDGIGKIATRARRPVPARLPPAPAAPKRHERWNDQATFPSLARIARGIVPTVHGEYAGHLDEWRRFGAHAWAQEFAAAGFDVQRLIRLPFYTGYGFGLERLRRLGERRGWSSHNAFVLTRAGEQPAHGRWFDAPELGIEPPPRRAPKGIGT